MSSNGFDFKKKSAAQGIPADSVKKLTPEPIEKNIINAIDGIELTNTMFNRWWKEFQEFFLKNDNALTLAVGVLVGQQSTKIVNSLSGDLLMPLLNPLVPNGGYKDIVIPYFGGEIAIGKLLDTTLEAVIVAWALFIVFKTVKRVERFNQPKEDSRDIT